MPAIKWFAGMASSYKWLCSFQDERRSVVTMNEPEARGAHDQSPDS